MVTEPAGPLSLEPWASRLLLTCARWRDTIVRIVTRRHCRFLLGLGIAAGALLVLSQGCARRRPAPPPVAAPPRPPAAGTLRIRLDQRIETLDVEEYVAGCVAAELGSVDLRPPAAARARDVQAILCRSYGLSAVGRHAAEGFDLCATTHCQLYRPVPATGVGRLSREAASRTAGQVLLGDGRPFRPAYHADCGGHTTTPGEVWGGPSPAYFASVADDACPRRPAWQSDIPIERLADLLRSATGVSVEGPLRAVAVERRDRSGRASWVRITGRQPLVIRGNDFRTAIIRGMGPSALPSTLFDIVQQGGRLRFEGRGNGHGVGLCEAGLIARAARGESPSTILAHYFPGSSVGYR